MHVNRTNLSKTTPSFSYLKKNWTTPHVTRQEIAIFTQGMFSPFTLAAYDTQGKGPAGRFRIGRNTAYSVDAVIQWLESRSQM